MSAAAMQNRSMHGDKTAAGALALAMHALFLMLLVFGVSWQKKAETPVMADLWSNLPPLQKPAVVPPPEPEPVLPKPAPKVVVPPPPKVEPKPAVKPDIALKAKEKAEKLKKKEPPPKAEPKKDDKAEKAAAEKLRVAKAKEAAEAKRKRDEEQRKRDEEFARLERVQEAKAAEARTAMAAQDKLVQEYRTRISNKIKSLIVEPPGLQGSPEAEFDVVLIPGGDVLTAKLRKSSGVPAYDAAVERAIMKAQPLPLPPDPALFSRFRELWLVIQPK